MHLPENPKLKHLVQHIKHTSILMLSWKLETLIIIIIITIIIIIIIIIVVVVIIMMLEIRVYIRVRDFH